MLPSTGHFKTIACPFYEEGSCDRPYCHFKHARREEPPSAVASASLLPEPVQALPKSAAPNAVVATASGSADTLSQLVSEAVKKVLAEQLVPDKDEISQNIVSKVVEELKPTLAGSLQPTTVPVEAPPIPSKLPIANSSSCTYNPTPISELKKRHISIPIYNPVRESKVTVKRKGSPTDDRTRSWHSILLKNDPADESTYKPTPVSGSNNSVPGYVPTAKTTSSSAPVSYDPSANETYVPKTKELYYPKPKKRREEYIPKKVKTPLNANIVGVGQYDVMDDVLGASAMDQDSNSQDFMEVEAKFSDDEEDNMEVENKNESLSQEKKEETTEVNNEGNKERLDSQEKENREVKHSIDKDEESKKSSSGSRKHSDRDKKSKDEQVNGSGHSGHKSRDKDGERESKKKDEKKHSSSRHDDKSRHSSKSSSKHSSSKDSSKKESRDKSKKEKERDKKDSSRHDSHRSKKSSKSDKESDDRHKKKSSSSSSSKDSKERKRRSSESSKHSDKSSKRSDKDKESSKSSSCRKEKEGEINEKLFLSEKDLFDDSDIDIEEECYKIFQEYEESDQVKPSKVSNMVKPETENVEEDLGKKRVAHPSAEGSLIRKPGPSQPIKKQPNPQQRLYERWRLMKEASEKAKSETKVNNQSAVLPETSSELSKPISQPGSHSNSKETFNGNGKVRIAHVPYAMTLALAKKPVIDKPKEPETRTPAQNIKNKGRVAHVPQVIPQLIRPEPLESSTQKFALNVRQFYVNMMHDVCVQIYTNGNDAVQRALTEEFACYERCKALSVYKNSCMLAIHRLKKELEQDKSDISVPSASKMVSHEAVLAGKTKGSWSVMRPKKIITNFKGVALYKLLTKWIMIEQQLKDNGYPRPHPDGQTGHVKVYSMDTRSHSVLSKFPNERICARCGQNYLVDKRGLAVVQQNCIYHWGRKFSVRGEGRYSCCQQYGSASGCSDAKAHVWDYVDYENLRGYVKTLPKDIPDEEQGVFSLDCEMCYTTQGLELTRVTVINEDCQVVYETLVKPDNPIIDYNTRFSGITEEIMENVTTTILDVQATLLTMFSSKTILIGHSLESDFKALKLIHDTVVDTSIMFPHRNGPPHKRALKNLCSEYLRKIIQNDVGGHDSNEDAVACMELVLWKVKEEAKSQ